MVKIGCFYTNLFLLEAIFPKEAHNTIIFRRVNIQVVPTFVPYCRLAMIFRFGPT